MQRPSVHVALLSALAMLVAATPLAGAAQGVTELGVSGLFAGAEHRAPATASNGTLHLVVWEEGDAVRGAVLNVGGAVVEGPFQIAQPAEPLAQQVAPAVAASPGGGFLVVWAEASAATSWNVRGARVSSAGDVVDLDGLELSTESDGTAPASGAQEWPAVAARGNEFLVVWQDGRLDAAAPDVFGTRVSIDGSVFAPNGIAISQRVGAQRRPAVASSGAGYLVAWEDAPASATADIYAARVDAITGLPSVELAISAEPGDQLRPSVTSNGAGYAVVWNDQRTGSWDLMVARVDGTGVLDASGILIAGVEADAPHAVASDGSAFLVVYERRPSGALSALGARFRASGDVADAEFPVDETNVVTPGQALAFSGFGRYLAVHRNALPGTPQLSAFLVTTQEPLEVLRAGTGSGTVTSLSAPGIDCGATCTAGFETGTQVQLGAAAAGGSIFEAWNGCESESGTTCTVTMSGPTTVTATFLAQPGAPGGPTYADIGATSLTVSWTTAAGATGYELWRAPAAGTGPGTYALVVAGAATSHSDTGLTPNATYWYRVRGTNGAGAGAYGPETSVTTLPGAPGTPIFTAIAADAVTVSWAAPAGGAGGYELERATSAGTDWILLATLAGTSHVDTTVAAATEYVYRVRATNGTGQGAYSATSSLTTLPLPPAVPAAPTYPAIAATSVTVAWTAVTGATSYDLERGPSATGPWTSAANDLAGTSHADGSLAVNTTYWYRVRASNSGGDSAFSSASSVTTLPGSAGMPTFGAITATSLTVTWTPPAGGADSYAVERAPAATGIWTEVATGLTSLSYPDSGLVAGTTYSYRVRATNAAGVGSYSATASVATLPDAPGAPTYTSVTNNAVTVSWTAVTGATGYKLEGAPNAGGAPGTWTQIAGGLTGTSYANSGLAAGTTYWYRVRATGPSGDGAYSPHSSVLTLPGAPGTPTFAAVTTTSLTVTWTAPAGAVTSYSVERAPTPAGTWTEVATGLTSLSYPDSGLVAGTSYSYRVRATNATGAGNYSATASVATLPDAPAAPTYTSVTSSAVTVSWTAVTGATGYKLERAPNSGGAPGTWTQIAGGLTGTSYTNTGLAAGTTYWYRVRATNGSGDGAYSPHSSVLTLPGAPGTPTFGAITTTSLTVTWTAPAGAVTSYSVERAPTPTGTWTEVATGLTSLSYPDSGLVAGTTYSYRVRATNATGVGNYSATASVPTLPGAPGAPTYANITSGSVAVSWAAVTGATGYKLERAPDVGGAPGTTWAEIASVPVTLYDDTTLAGNTRYWYRLRAFNASGDGAYSPESSVLTVPRPPGTPTFTSVTPTSLTVSWTAPPGGAVSYELERSTSADGTFTPIGGSLTALGYDDAGLAPGVKYWYRVRGVNATGPGPYSTASVTTLPAGGSAPWYTGVSTVSLTVNWTAIAGATTYHVERALDASGQPGTWEPAAAGLTDTYRNEAVAANTTYWYRVRGANESGYGGWSPPSSVTTLANAPSAAPTFTNVTDTSLTVNWTAPAGGAASYVVERAISSAGPWSVVTTQGVTALSWNDSGLSPETTYWYRIRAINSTGVTGAPSSIRAVTTLSARPSGAPGAPTYGSVGTTSVVVAWTAALDATSYQLERAPDAGGVPGAWVEITSGSLRTYTDTALGANTPYWYRVRGSNEGGAGPYSSPSSVVTLPNAPAAPTFSSIATTSVTVSWSAPAAGAAGYQLSRATSASGPWGTPVDVAGTSHTATGLSAGTTYWYRVRATNSAGGVGAYSASASVTTLAAAPVAPTYSNVAVTSLTVSWTAVSGAASYQLERSTAADGPWTELGAAIAATTHGDTGVSANATYWYRVAARNGAGALGPYSPASTVTTLPGAPGAPTFPAIGTTTLTVSWAAPAGGAASYVVERSTSDKPWAVVSSGLAGPSYPDTGLTPNGLYYYRVRATNALGQSGPASDVASVTTNPDASTPPPGTPGTPAYSSVGATALTISWSAATGVEIYALDRAADAGGAPAASWTQIASVTTLSHRDTGRTANTAYWYRVRASSVSGTTVSGASRVMTAPNAPGAPTFPAVTSASVTVSWTAPAGGAATYKVERAPSAIGPWALLGAGILATSLEDAVSGNTTYYYRVRATNAAGLDGLYSASRSVTTPADTTPLPGIPAAPTYSGITATYLKVSWAPVTDATGYKLERAAASTGPWTQIAVTTATSLTDWSRTANTTYWYRVRASNGGGDGPSSDPSSAMTAPTAPGAPTFPSVGATAVTVSWTAPTSGAARYKLERATSSIGPWTAVASGIVPLTHIDSGLTGYTTYYYRVRATNSAGVDGAASASRSVLTAEDATTEDPGQPGTPVYPVITATYVKVSWAAATGATSYKLERAPASTGPWAQIAATAATSFTDTGRAPNTPYWYRVRGTSGGGDGPYSSESSAMTAPNAPGAPVFSAVGSTTLTVSWTAPTGGAASYKLERATSALGPWTALSGIPAPSYADSGLGGYTTYYYRVRATNSAGLDGASSASRSILTAPDGSATAPGAPGAPTYSSITATYAKVSWAAATDATSYKLERAMASTGPWAQIVTTTATSFTDAGRTANTVYWYRVRGSNGAGDGVYSSASSVVTAPNAPGAPDFTDVTSTTLTATWAAPAGGAASYRLERATSSVGPWTQVAAGITAVAQPDAGLAPYMTYYYRVRATNAAGVDGLASSTRSVATAAVAGTPIPSAPGVPTFSSVNASWLKVSWTAATDATAYALERAGTSDGPWSLIATVATTSFSDAGRSANTRYWYRVRGSNPGGAGPYSEVSSAMTAPNAPGAPTFGSVEATTLTVSWVAPAGGAARYRVERATSSLGPWLELASGVTTQSHADSGLAASTTYYYRVRATNEDGVNGAYSLVKPVTTAAVPGS